MLVKITKFSDGWQIRALGGKNYNEIIGKARGVVLQNVRYGNVSITGDLISTWELDIAPHCVGTATQRSLSCRKQRPERFKFKIRHDDAGFHVVDCCPNADSVLDETNRLCVVDGEMSFDREAGFVRVKGV